MPYATVRMSGIFPPNTGRNSYGLPGMYENPLKTLPFQVRERPERKSPYENIDQLGRPYANHLEYLFFQPRYENEADNGTCDVVLIKPGYDKLTPGTRRKRRENYAPSGHSPYGAVDKSGMPVYDSIIREIKLKCRNRREDFSDSESDEDREMHTIMEVPSCDERSQASTIQRTTTEELLNGNDSDDTISLEDIDFGCIGIDWKTSTGIHPQLPTSWKSDSMRASRSQTALHMEDQTGLFGFYKSNPIVKQDTDA